MRPDLYLFFLLFSAAAATLSAQGGISGRVVNAVNGEPVREARVFVLGHAQAVAVSDLEGRYFVEGIPAGTHNMRVFRAGFELLAITDVSVGDEKSTRLDIRLSPVEAADIPGAPRSGGAEDGANDVYELQALVVTAGELKTADATLLNVRQRSGALSDGLGSETMARLGVSDAAEAMSKVTGASIVDGKYVVIRGLGDRYTNTLLNNISVPSADPDKRAVQLDQFPSEVLESVVTSKSFTPDQPGAFAGGSVNLRTKSFPDAFFAQVTGGLSVNTNVVGEDVLQIPGGSRDWLAKDDGTRALPAELPQGQFPGPTQVRVAAARGDESVAAEFQRINDSFHNAVYFPSNTSGRPGYSGGASIGDRIAMGSEAAIGYVLSLTYDNAVSHYTGGAAANYSQGSNNFDSDNFVNATLVYTPDRSQLSYESQIPSAASLPELGPNEFGVTETVWRANWSGFGQVAYSPTRNHEFAVRVLHNQNAEDQIRRGVGESTRSDSGRLFAKYTLLYTERSVSSTQLAGKSVFPGLDEVVFEWRVAYSKSTQDQPDFRTINLFYNMLDDAVAQGNVRNFRLFRDLEEDNLEGSFDLTIPLARFWKRDATIKTGALMSDGTRIYRGHSFSYRNQVSNLESLRNYPNTVGIVSREGTSFVFGNNLERANLPSPDYDGSQRITAGYLMADIAATKRLRAIFGVRAEKTELEIDPVFGRDAWIDQTDMLPALSFVYSLTDSMNLRAAYGRTVARPIYRELAPTRVEDPFLEIVNVGNPDLKLSEIDNFDLRWEWFPRSEETVAVSFFYKKIAHPIELVFDLGVGAVTPQNREEGTILGIEVEYRQHLGTYWEPLRGLSLGMNVAWIQSEVEVSEDEMEIIRRVLPEAEAKRDFFDQPSYTFNFDATYFVEGTNTSLTLVYNLVGEALSLVNFGPLPDYYRQPLGRLDLLISQPFARHWRLKFAASNLLDAEREESFAHHGTDYARSAYRIGRSFSLGLTYVF